MSRLFRHASPASIGPAWLLRAVVGAAGIAAAAAGLNALATPAPDDEKTGGETTVFATGRNAFSFPLANLPDDERTRFVIGNSFFRRNWVQAPASTKARDGLGPHFIARSCGGCHVQDGRGAPPDISRGLAEQPVGLLMRLSIPGKDAHGGPLPDLIYGDQFSNFSVLNVLSEGDISLRYETLRGKFADGTPYQLLKPKYGFSKLNYGPMHKDVMISPRIAPQMAGVGLLEAIPEAEILRNAREQAASGGPVRGIANQVWDAPTQQMRLGRFGWKANVATLAHQTGGAFQGDMGITSTLFAKETCTAAQKDCLAAPRGAHGAAVEIDDSTFDDVVFYEATLAPAARRNAKDPQVLQGQKLFAAAACVECHRPSYVTNDGAARLFPRLTSKALQNQTIWPYTDLLVHDMGPGLADGRPDFLASGQHWRTPPLWGVGLIPEVNGHNRLLHDGRARGVMEAVLWHDGEARNSKNAVLKMSAAERQALVKFLESL
ncbi:MAG: di-heme oxidoredictase family protein [Polaromonas sp.]|nr:di-heme oxidoredictase family protein [Polaromonas sp.]